MTKSVCYTDANGTKVWRLPNSLHHREDGPALEYSNGSKVWYFYGKCHRKDGPAVELSDGYKAWVINGILHREDGPEVERADGIKEWYLDGTYFGDSQPYNWEELVNLYQVERIMNG